MKHLYVIQLIICLAIFYEPITWADDLDRTSLDSEGQEIDSATGFNLGNEVRRFQMRYNLKKLSQKLIDNRGRGPRELYGTRNFRVVLPGVLYRGGANNAYLKSPRSNINPLPIVGLKNLCKEEFSTAVYLYTEHFSRAPQSVVCEDKDRAFNTLKYKQYAAAGENEKILGLIYNRIKGRLKGPIYVHCWNGWHASGLISGMALKQFCGWTNSQVEAYWVRNTDGNSSGHPRTRARLRHFKPYLKYAITNEERALVCPKDFSSAYQ